MNDYVSYLNALQASSMVSQTEEQKKDDKVLPIEEESSLPGLALGGASGVLGVAKSIGVSFLKDTLKSKMKELGVDDDTIDNVLKGDLNEVMQSKVGEVISKLKGMAQEGTDTAKGLLQDAVDTAKGSVEDVVNTAKQTLQDSIETMQDTANNIKSNVMDVAQGPLDDLTAQSQQETSMFSNMSLSEIEQGAQNIFSRVTNYFTGTPSEPQSIEMVDMAAPEVESIAPEVSSTLSGALSQIQSGVSGIAGLTSEVASTATGIATTATEGVSALAGTAAAAAGEAVGDGVLAAIGTASSALGPLGIIAGLVGGIVGGIEMHKEESQPMAILNPSSQFL